MVIGDLAEDTNGDPRVPIASLSPDKAVDSGACISYIHTRDKAIVCTKKGIAVIVGEAIHPVSSQVIERGHKGVPAKIT